MRLVTFTVLTLNRCLCDFDRIMGIVCILSILFFLCQRNFLQIWATTHPLDRSPWPTSPTNPSQHFFRYSFTNRILSAPWGGGGSAAPAAWGPRPGPPRPQRIWIWIWCCRHHLAVVYHDTKVWTLRILLQFFWSRISRNQALETPRTQLRQFHGTLEPGTGFDPEACGEACEALAEAVAKGNQHQAWGILVKWRGEGDDYDLWWWCWW